MSDLLIVLLPPLPGEQWSRRETAAELAAYNFQIKLISELPAETIDGDLDLAGAWVAHCALEMAQKADRSPALLVAQGGAGRMLAALGFSQRASRRRVVGYVVVDGELPKADVQDWPDAPVTYIGDRESHLADLRGWEVLPNDDLGARLRELAAASV
ncbi:MAG: hypothetical protein R2720_03900 [Candidatus Nanopelagicales bacterium]